MIFYKLSFNGEWIAAAVISGEVNLGAFLFPKVN